MHDPGNALADCLADLARDVDRRDPAPVGHLELDYGDVHSIDGRAFVGTAGAAESFGSESRQLLLAAQFGVFDCTEIRNHTEINEAAAACSSLIFLRFGRCDRLLGVSDETVRLFLHPANELFGVLAEAVEIELESAAGRFGDRRCVGHHARGHRKPE